MSARWRKSDMTDGTDELLKSYEVIEARDVMKRMREAGL